MIPSFPQFEEGDSGNYARMNELMDSLAGGFVLTQDHENSAGLVLALFGGRWNNADLAAQVLSAFSASTTNYVEADPTTGTATSNTSGYTGGKVSLGIAITNTTGIVSYVQEARGAGGGSASATGIPQNSQSANYTLVASDANKHIYHPSADTTARTWTIPANSSVAFPIGTAVTFVNDHSAGTITIAITSDTLRLAGAGTTGSRTLAADGNATALKITSTSWQLVGTGVT